MSKVAGEGPDRSRRHSPRHINSAEEVSNEVFPPEQAVAPLPECKLRLGLTLMSAESGGC